MSKRVLIILLLVFVNLLVLPLGCMAPAPPRQGKETITISVQPVYSLHVLSQKYSPLLTYLSRETGYSMRLISAITYYSYLPTLAANQVQIGIQDPIAYITLVKTRRAYPLVKMVGINGLAEYRGVIFTRHGNGIDGITDLRGKKVAAASRRSAGGFLAQAIICKNKGIDVDKDLSLFFVDTENAVIDAVYSGKAEAGFVGEDALSLARERADSLKSIIIILTYTDYLPAWCVAAFDDTPPEVATAIDRALLSLDREKSGQQEILRAIGIGSFQKAFDSDYNTVRELMSYINIPY